MKNLLFIIALMCFIASCDKHRFDVTVKGRIMRRSDSTAYAKTPFVLFQRSNHNYNHIEKESVPFTTDDNGYFYVTFRYRYDGIVWLCWPDNVNENDGIREMSMETGGGKVKDEGTIYLDQ